MVAHCCQSKNKTKVNKKENKENKIKSVYWPITAKMTTLIQLKNFLTPHSYKSTSDVQLTSNFHQMSQTGEGF